MANMEEYHKKYENYVTICSKLSFFNLCKGSKIIPKGLVIEKNLATEVNDQDFVLDFQASLNEASSRCFDKIIEKFEYREIKLEEEIEELEDNLEIHVNVRNEAESW